MLQFKRRIAVIEYIHFRDMNILPTEYAFKCSGNDIGCVAESYRTLVFDLRSTQIWKICDK